MYQLATAPESIGGVLDNGFKLFRASFVPLFPLVVLSTLATTVPATFFSRYVQRFAGEGLPTWTRELGAEIFVGGVLTFLLVVVFTAAILVRIDAVANGRSMSLGQAFTAGLGRTPALFGTMLLAFLIVFLGCLLVVIPGIILSVWYIFAPYVAAIESRGPIESLARARALVRGHWWRTAALLTLVGIVAGVLYIVLGIAAGIVVALNPEQIAEGTLPWYLDYLLSPLLSAITTPLATSLIVATYYDLKIRHEGGDLAARIAAAA